MMDKKGNFYDGIKSKIRNFYNYFILTKIT